MAAHLDSGLDVPDLHELVKRPSDDALAVPRESDGPHQVRVTRQRANLPPTHLDLRWWYWIMARISTTFVSNGDPGEWRDFLSGLEKPDRRNHHVKIEKNVKNGAQTTLCDSSMWT